MKKLLLFILLVSSIRIFSQEIASKEVNIDVNNIYEKVDKMPEYPGGINAFQKKFSQAFDKSNISETGNMSTEAQFVVSKEGFITEIVALGNSTSLNQEVKRAIYTVKEKWTPAQINGKTVNFRFRLPVKMNIP